MSTKTLALAGLALCLLSTTTMAAPAKITHKMAAKKTTAAQYECQKCHMKVSAAVAKKDHYKDPMDGGKLVPVAAGTKKPAPAKPMGSMSM